jgi:hypothetical protein
MALLSFVESAPRAYRLKVGNADLFRNSTEPGTSPQLFVLDLFQRFDESVIVEHQALFRSSPVPRPKDRRHSRG